MKDKAILFLLYTVVIPILFVAIAIFAIREEIEHRRSYGRKDKPSEDSLPKER